MAQLALFIALLGPVLVSMAIKLANAAPQSFAPFLGALLIGGAAKDYNLLYVVAAVVTFVGAAAVIPVRKVK